MIYDGSVLIATQVVNTISAVCNAKSGVFTIHDLPFESWCLQGGRWSG